MTQILELKVLIAISLPKDNEMYDNFCTFIFYF